MNNNPNLDFYGYGAPELQPNEPKRPENDRESESEQAAHKATAQTVEQAKTTFSRLGLGVVLLVAGWYGIVFLLRFVFREFAPSLAQDTTLMMLVGTLPLYLVGLPLMYATIRNQPRAIPQKRPLGAWFFVVFFISMFFLVVGAITSNVLMSVLGALRGEPYVNSLDSVLGLPIPLLFFLTVICAPIFEELICRKLLLERALPFGELPAILFTSAIFGLLHGNLFQLLYAFLLGVIFSYVYLRTGKLRYSIALHMIINFIGGVLPAIILQSLDINELAALMQDLSATGQAQEYLTFLTENIGMIVLELYLLALQYVGALAGLILLIVFRKRIRLEKREGELPREHFSAMFFQVGGIVMLLILIGITVYSLLL